MKEYSKNVLKAKNSLDTMLEKIRVCGATDSKASGCLLVH